MGAFQLQFAKLTVAAAQAWKRWKHSEYTCVRRAGRPSGLKVLLERRGRNYYTGGAWPTRAQKWKQGTEQPHATRSHCPASHESLAPPRPPFLRHFFSTSSPKTCQRNHPCVLPLQTVTPWLRCSHTHLETLSTNMKPLKSVCTLPPMVELSPLPSAVLPAAPALLLSRGGPVCIHGAGQPLFMVFEKEGCPWTVLPTGLRA